MRQTITSLMFSLGLVACAQEPAAAPAKALSSAPAEPSRATVSDAAPAATPLVPTPTRDAFLDYEQNTIDVFKAVAPATVFVTQRRLVRDRWSRRAAEVPSGSGTGFIWDTSGHVVTNYHVIDKARSLTVTLQNGKIYPAELVGGDPRKDIAVLKIAAPAAEMTVIRLPPRENHVEVGQKAVAIGNPFGLDHTLTTGVISAIGREVKGFGGVTIRDMLQTDAAINAGNSGGPLLDSRGQLIGVNTMIFSAGGGSVGVGFAVPVFVVRRVVPQIIKYGKPQRAGLGIEQVEDAIARMNGVRGVVIERVLPGSAADKAGLKGLRRDRLGLVVGDIIVAVGGEEVIDFDTLYNALDRYRPGDRVVVTILRDKRKADVDVELELLD